MKILVTGAAGFVGSHLTERLLAEGHTVYGIDSLDPYYSPALKDLNARTLRAKGAEMITADLASDDLSAILPHVDYIFHLAAQPGNSARTPLHRYIRNNVEATGHLLAYAERLNGFRGFVNISTSSVYGLIATCDETAAPTPVSNYGVTKLAAEQLVLARYRERKFPACSLRLFSVYGERERPDKLFPRLLTALAEDLEFPLFDGSLQHTRSFTYVGDAVEGMLLVLSDWNKANGEIFNIGGGMKISTGQAISIVEELYGKTAKKKILPPRSGDQLETAANVSKASKLLGFQPRTLPERGLANMVAWFRDSVEGKLDYR